MKDKFLLLGSCVTLIAAVIFAGNALAHSDGVRLGFYAGEKSKYFLLDENGKVLKELNCQFVQPYSEGLAMMRKRTENKALASIGIPVGNEKAVFIDINGNEVKMPAMNRASSFSQGVAWAEKDRKNHILLDKSGKEVAKINDEWLVSEFSEDLAAVMIDSPDIVIGWNALGSLSNRWGYINKQGSLAIPLKFSYAGAFHQGAAQVRDPKGRWCLIDKKGNQLGEKYDDVDPVWDQMARMKSGTKYGFLNNTGKLVIPPVYSDARRYGEGLAAIKQNNKFGFIDKSAKIKIVPQYLDALYFREGLCPVKAADKKWGFINSSGSMVIKPIFADALPFSEGRALVQVGDSIAFIDKSGRFVVAPKYDLAFSYSNKRTVVSLGSAEEKKKNREAVANWEKMKLERGLEETHLRPGETFTDLSNQKGTQSTLPKGASPDGKYSLEKIAFSLPRLGDGSQRLILENADGERLQEYSASFAVVKKNTDQFAGAYINDYSWAPDSKHFVYAADCNLFFCNAETKERMKWTEGQSIKEFLVSRFSPDGRFIAVGGTQGGRHNSVAEFMVLDAKTKKIVFRPDIFASPQAAWSPDAKMLALKYGPECLRILDVDNNWQVIKTINNEFGKIAWSPDGKYLASCKFNEIEIFDLEGNLLQIEHVNQVGEITWKSDGKEILYSTDILFNKQFKTLKVQLQSKPKQEAASVQEVQDSPGVQGVITTLPKYGVINMQGNEILPFDYFSIQERSDGGLACGLFDPKNPFLSPVSTDIIDKSGKKMQFTVPEGMVEVEPVNDLVIVKKDEKIYPELTGVELFGVCNRQGKIILDANYDKIEHIGNKFILATDRNGMVNIFELNGTRTGTIPFGFHLLREPRNGGEFEMSGELIPVESRDIQSQGFFDSKGNPVGKFGNRCFKFSDGIASVSSWKKPAQFIDKTGKVLFEVDGESVTPYKDGYCVIRKNEKCGVIDKAGKFVIEPKYDWLKILGENRFAGYSREINTIKNVEIVDSSGKIVFKLPANTTSILEYSDGLIPFSEGGIPDFVNVRPGSGAKWGYLDSAGKVVIAPRFFSAQPFVNGYAQVAEFGQSSNKVCLIDKNGKVVIEPKYASLQVLGDGRIIAAKASDVHFSPLDWKSKSKGYGTEKMQLFYGLLKDYDLIGMPKNKLLALLGTPTHPNDSIEKDFISYTLAATGCINEHKWLVVQFQNEKVKCWRLAYGMFEKEPVWITENVVYEELPSITDERKVWSSATDGRVTIPKYKGAN